jgi:hypothetical protein
MTNSAVQESGGRAEKQAARQSANLACSTKIGAGSVFLEMQCEKNGTRAQGEATGQHDDLARYAQVEAEMSGLMHALTNPGPHAGTIGKALKEHGSGYSVLVK